MSPGQTVEIVVNGTTVSRVSPEQQRDFETVHVPVVCRAGGNRVELRCMSWEPQSSDSGRAMPLKSFGRSERRCNRRASARWSLPIPMFRVVTTVPSRGGSSSVVRPSSRECL
jgi:hypothetical protein